MVLVASILFFLFLLLQTFLKQEHSEENLLFWLACDEFKKTVAAIPSMVCKI